MVYQRRQAFVEVWEPRTAHPLPLLRYLHADHTAPATAALTLRHWLATVA